MQTHGERQNNSTQITHGRKAGREGRATKGEVSYYQFISLCRNVLLDLQNCPRNIRFP